MIDMTGILWTDITKKRPVAECVQAAAARYQAKFGHRPDTCYVRKVDGFEEINGVQVRVDKYRQPFEYWVGVTGKAPVDVEPGAEPEPEVVEVEEAKPKATKAMEAYTCKQCGATWLVPMAWCAECGNGFEEAA